MSPPTLADPNDPATGTAPTADPARNGERRIGRYRLLRELGRGGMGTVYLAVRDDQQFTKRVALKVIRGGADSAEVVRHFKRERQILASLDHPNIARLLDGGATDDGLPYLVMEYIEGDQILGYCDSKALGVPERLRLFQSVCSAVQYAHRNLIVHRDIKPGNILVTEDGSPRLLDFGIAKLLNPELAGEAPTGTAMVMTPAYASPEQVRGERISTASDVYSLGVVLYELLTGQHPHGQASRQPLAVLKAIAEQEPEKPSTAAARTEDVTEAMEGSAAAPPDAGAKARNAAREKLKRRLRGDLDNILMMALRKEPQRRYASVEAFSDDIRRYLEGMPIEARKPTAWYRAGKFVRRHVLGVAAAALVVVLLLGFAVAMAVQSARVARERDLARKERETAQRVSGFLVDLFKVSDPSEARGNSVTAREVLDKGAAQIGTGLQDQPAVRATLMDTMGNVYRNLFLLDKALPLLRDALATRRAVLGNENLDVARSLNSLALVLDAKADYEEAEALDREALAIRSKLLGNESAEVASSLSNLANVVYHKGDLDGAETLQRQALAMRRKLFGNEHLDVAMSLNNLANVIEEKRDFAGAEAMHREALALKRKLLGDDNPDVAKSLNNLANLLYDRGDLAGAEDYYRQALVVNRKLFGQSHPRVAQNLHNLANVMLAKSDYPAAEPLFREALAINRTLRGSQHPDVATSMAGLAETLCREGKPAEAEPIAREALAVFNSSLPGHPYIAEAESILGESLALSHRFAEAEPLLLDSYPILKAETGEKSQETRKALQRLVALYDDWGRPKQSAEYQAQLVARGISGQR